MPTKLEHALALAQRGFYVFPLEVNSKVPLSGFPWHTKSSKDPKTIQDWWIDPFMGWQQDYNIGVDCGKSGLVVFDVDCKDGKEGLSSWKKIEAEYDTPETYLVHTPSGGLHFYYKGSGYGNTQGDNGGLAKGLDTRGEGGYVVAEGSAIDGKSYLREDLAPREGIPELNYALKELLKRAKVSLKKDAGKTIIADHEGDIAWAVDYLTNEAEPAIQGSGGDHHTYVTICRLKERGISKETALDLLLEHWNDSCSPPWTPEELIVKINSAYKSAQNATGVKSPYAEFGEIALPEALKTPTECPLKPIRRFKLADIPKRPFIFGNLMLRKKVSILVAPGGMGKSTLTLTMALSKATGKPLLGIDPRGRGRVAVTNNEDDMEEMERRIGALMQHHCIPFEELYDEDVRGDAQSAYLYLTSGENNPLRIAKRAGQNNMIKPDQADAMVEHLINHNIDMWIVDPFAETHPAKENDNEEILAVGRIYRSVAQRANCGLLLVHHTRKLDNASSDGHSGNLDSMRGASSLGGLARVVFTFNTMGAKQAKEYGIDEDQKHKFVLLEQAKANMSAASSNKHWFEWHSETINATLEDPQGESVGVLRPVTMAHKRDSVSENIRTLIKDLEVMVEHAPVSVVDIADDLVTNFPLYQGKQRQTVVKTLRRLFSEGIVTGFTGTLLMEESRTDDKAAVQHIRFVREERNSINDLL